LKIGGDKAIKHRIFYDSVLLRLLDKSYYPADQLFEKLFSRNKIQQVFKFLDNESAIKEDIRIISSLPFMPFLKSALEHLL
jgi:lycopene beta-cyclase